MTYLPTDRLETWMDSQGLGSGPIAGIAPLSGGTQNVMTRFERDGRGYILRRGPEHLRPGSNAVMQREFRVLAALAGTPVPHPRLIASCADTAVLGDAVFYLMEPVDGFNASVELPALHRDDPVIRHRMGLAAVDALATLGTVDHETVGLGDFGKPDGFLERQVSRWLAELASFDQFEAYPGPRIGDVTGVAGWLAERVPARWSPGILHGDFHAANVMFSRGGSDVVAIVDWEMCTVGDPLLDLGWLLATWDLPGSPDEFAGLLMRAGGVASAQDLAERYAVGSTRDLTHLTWYVVLACFKLGIILEGTHARACAGLAPADVGDRLHQTTVRLFERAHELMDGNQ